MAFVRVVPLAVAVALAAGCAGPTVKKPDPAPPPPTFTGPVFLHGTVGSMCRLQNYQPMLVSGYGLVVMPPGTGTGSSEVPAYLRQWMLNEMRRKGLGSIRYNTANLSPEAMLASTDTAVVAVQGFIPPGATKGTRFDVLVSALPETQTTSLEGGQLWTADLAIGGTNRSMQFSRALAQSHGSIYINPLADKEEKQKEVHLRRQGVVIAGGVVTEPRRIELLLNQRSWQRSRQVADRINERFPRGRDDTAPTAEPKTDLIIRINVPKRYAGRPDDMLALMSHVYLQSAPDFVPAQARSLGEILLTEPKYADNVALAWEAMGKTVLPIVRQFYTHEDLNVRFTALLAGIRLEDETTTEHLYGLARHQDPAVRRRCAALLVNLPSSLRGANVLETLLDDPDRSVRIAAYESLSAIGDPIIRRFPIGDETEFKFSLELVPSKRPLVYVVQTDLPRLVIFHEHTGFKSPVLAKLWDGRLRLRGDGAQEPVTVFYQPPGEARGATNQIAPTVANLALLLAHHTTPERPSPGLDLSYSQVISAIHDLAQEGVIDAEFEVQENPLAKRVAESLKENPEETRPEFERKSGDSKGLSQGQSPYAPLTATAGPNPAQAPATPDRADALPERPPVVSP